MDEDQGVRLERFFTEGETAKLLRLSKRTLQRHRRQGTGPSFVKMGERIRYATGDIARWTQSHTHQGATQPSEVRNGK